MRTEILNAFLERNKVLTTKTDLTKWKFDSYVSLGKEFRKLPVLSNEDKKLVLLPAEYWNDTGPIFGILHKDGKLIKHKQRKVRKDIIDDNYDFLLAGSLNSPVYQEVLRDDQ